MPTSSGTPTIPMMRNRRPSPVVNSSPTDQFGRWSRTRRVRPSRPSRGGSGSGSRGRWCHEHSPGSRLQCRRTSAPRAAASRGSGYRGPVYRPEEPLPSPEAPRLARTARRSVAGSGRTLSHGASHSYAVRTRRRLSLLPSPDQPLILSVSDMEQVMLLLAPPRQERGRHSSE